MNMKANMALSALVCAGLVAWLSGFASEAMVAPKSLKEDAVKIEVAVAAPAPAAEVSAVTDAAAGGTAAPAAAPVAVLAMIEKADVARGKTVAKACMACHTFDNGGKNGVGPNLYGIVGHKKQSVTGFSYSGSLNAQGGDVWTYGELSKFLEKPKAYAPKTKMTFVGIKKPEDRAAVLAYLRSLNNAPAPTAAEIAAEGK